MRFAFSSVSTSVALVSGIVATMALCGDARANGLPVPPALSMVAPRPTALKLETLGATTTGDDFVRAIATRHQPLIEMFFAAAVDVNARNADGRTALLAACMAEEWRLAERLLHAGADATLCDAAKRTPLMIAALHGNRPMLEALLAKSADCTATDAHGHSALHYAVAARQRDLATVLLEKEPNLAEPCCDGATLLTHALQTGDWQLIEPILTRSPGGLRWSAETRAFLATALNHRDAARVRLLLSKHAAAPTPEGSAQPLLAWAIARNDIALCRFLLECGADPNTTVNTPAEKEFLDIVPNNVVRHYLENEPGMNSLMLAAGLARVDFVKLLLEKGANRTTATRSKHKLIPVYFAAWGQSPESIQLLLGNAPPPDKLRVEISLSAQRASLIKNGIPVLSTEISSGRPGFSTPQGRFVVTDKHQSHVSSIYKVKMPFFMRLNCRDFGMHEGYVPDYPASHGCIRVPSMIARRLFQEVPVGTLVTIAH